MIEQLQQLGLSPEAQALAQGLLLGDKSALSPDVVQDFRTAGMSHIMAVSGLHVGIIMSVIWMMLKPLEWAVLLIAPIRMKVYYAIGLAKRVLTILLVMTYVWYIGAPASAVRAAVMLSLCLVGWMLHRPTSAWRCLILAALGLLAYDPWALATPGFQLSFLAVCGILLFQPWLQSRRLPWWFRVILLSLAAQWLTAPIVAYWFHQLPLLACMQGLLVVPLLPLHVFLLLTGIVFPTWHYLALPIHLLTAWAGMVAQCIGRLEELLLGGHLYFYPDWWEVLVFQLLLLAIVCYLRLRRHAPITPQQRKAQILNKRKTSTQ